MSLTRHLSRQLPIASMEIPPGKLRLARNQPCLRPSSWHLDFPGFEIDSIVVWLWLISPIWIIYHASSFCMIFLFCVLNFRPELRLKRWKWRLRRQVRPGEICGWWRHLLRGGATRCPAPIPPIETIDSHRFHCNNQITFTKNHLSLVATISNWISNMIHFQELALQIRVC